MFVLLLSGVQAQEKPTVRSVSITGNVAFTANEILRETSLNPGSPTDSAFFARQAEQVLSLYREEGFLFAEVEINPTGDAYRPDVHITIRENKPVFVDSVVLAGAASIPVDLLRRELTILGRPLRQTVIEEDIQRMLRVYEGMGYPTTGISVADLVIHGSEEGRYGCTVVLEINEGIRATLEGVRIEGNSFTKDHVILREIPYRNGEVFTDEFAALVRRSLERTQLFASVATPEFVLSQDQKGFLLVKVQEGSPNRFDGMIGYSPPVKGTVGVVTGLVHVHFGNLFGTGRRLTARWMKESALTQELSLWYLEPWLASLPLDLEGGFGQRKQDSSYIRRSYSGRVVLRLTTEVGIGLTLEHMNVVPAERETGGLPGSTSLSVGATIRYDTRDNAVTPTSGVLYGTSAEFGRKRIGGDAPEGTNRVAFDVEAYGALSRVQVVAVALHGRDFSASRVEDADLFRLGGTTTLRGYRENQFRGSRIAWSSFEYRLLAEKRSYFFGFVDLGYIRTPDIAVSGLSGSEITRWGFGAGARLDTGLGLITVGLAFGEGDTFRTAKLHFRLVNEF